MPNTPIVIVRGPGRPHEAFLFAISIPLGVGILLTAPAPQSVVQLLPPWLVAFWAGALAVSGIAGCASLMWGKQPIRALQLERGALIINGASLLLFAVAAAVVNGGRSWFAVSFFAAWAAADLARSRQIKREVRRTLPTEKEP